MAAPVVTDHQLPEKTRRPRNRCRKLKSRVAMRNFYEVINKNRRETKEELAAMEKHRAGDETFATVLNVLGKTLKFHPSRPGSIPS